MSLKLERMSHFIELFDTQCSAKIGRRIGLMTDFIAEYANFKETTFGQYGATFNIFNILNISNDELKHSAMVAWLLDARGNHYQGNLFFNAFLQLCNIDSLVGIPSRYAVRREFPGAESRIDVLVFRRGEFLIYIENKVSSEEDIEQCAREFRDMHCLGSRLDIPQGKRFAIFLTPDVRNPVTDDPTRWITLSYQRLRDSFEQLVPQITLDKVRSTLEDWLEVISNFGRE